MMFLSQEEVEEEYEEIHEFKKSLLSSEN